MPSVTTAPLDLRTLTRVAVGSTNPVKVGAVRAVLDAVAPLAAVEPIALESGVSDQPRGDDQAIRPELRT